MSSAGSLYKSIDANSYLRELADGHIVLDHFVGVKNDGTIILVVRELKTVKKGAKKLQVKGDFRGYNITDLVGAVGALSVLQSTSPWIVSAVTADSRAFLGNSSFTPTVGTGSINGINVKSAILIAAAGGSSRGPLTVAGVAAASKTVAPSTTGDLLDHELVVQNGNAIAVSGGVAGDTAVISFLNLR